MKKTPKTKVSKVPLAAPTLTGLKQLFRELDGGYFGGPAYMEYRDLERQIDDLREELCNVPELKQLQKKKDAAYRRHEKHRLEVAALRREFLAKGATPEILKKIAALVDRVNSFVTAVE